MLEMGQHIEYNFKKNSGLNEKVGVNKLSVNNDNEPMSTASRAIDAKLLFPSENRHYKYQ